MRRIIFLIAFLSSSFLSGQIGMEDELLPKAGKQIPREKVFLHYNNSLLFVGEYMYFQMYCLNSETEGFSNISKIGYVELVGENRKRVFRHKISLEEGTGQGDFFIPTSVPSGNYKLLGYTRWMLNNGTQAFYQGDVVIINPYSNQQEALLSGSGMTEEADGLLAAGPEETSQELISDSEVYGKREKVSLTVEISGKESGGKYSVSVRKLEIPHFPPMASAVEFSSAMSGPGKDFDLLVLPEMRGELYTGHLRPKAEAGELSVNNRIVSLSIPGQDPINRISRTSPEGRFFFNVERATPESTALIQVMGEAREDLEVVVGEMPEPDYSSLEFVSFQISPDIRDMITSRSIRNQIESAYFSAKPDTLRLSEEGEEFFGNRMTTYNLDDYTRFKTVKETFVEIIDFISIRKEPDGGEVLDVFGARADSQFDLPPLLLVDGTVVQDHGDFIQYPAHKIRSIGILRDKYFLGPEVFQGIVKVETLDGNFHTERAQEYVRKVELLRPQSEKQYFRQVYAEGDNSRIPDLRTQLLWEPDLELTPGTPIEFFTSDVPGIYEVRVEGFTPDGRPVSLLNTFQVK